MPVLEKILQEIENFKRQKYDPRQSKSTDELEILCLDKIANIIRPCMKDDGWIPVEMKNDEWTSETVLPEEGQKVFVTISYNGNARMVERAYFEDGSFWDNRHIAFDYITKAWMPRFAPAPYQTEEEK